MAHRHFCTYFDHRYLAQGLALHGSLVRTCPSFTLWVLALSEEAERMLDSARLQNLRVVPLRDLEAFDPELRATRATRSLVEYYFTCSPCLPRLLMTREQAMEEITYLDSDLFFFASPEAVFDEIGNAAVAITPHRFSPQAAASHLQYGRYNVGWLTFRRRGDGPACLDWWRARCIEWCYDRVEADRYADQKYLERFATLFKGVHAIEHPGANLAPWNVDRATVTFDDGVVRVDARPLVFFHFQGLRHLWADVYDSNLTGYGAHMTPELRQGVFEPYIADLRSAEAIARKLGPAQPAERIRRRGQGLERLRYAAGRTWRSLRAAIAGNLLRVGASRANPLPR